MYRSARDEEFLIWRGAQELVAQLDLRAQIQNHPELVAAVVVLAGEYAARLDGDDLDGRGKVVGVLLEVPPRFLRPDSFDDVHEVPFSLLSVPEAAPFRSRGSVARCVRSGSP